MATNSSGSRQNHFLTYDLWEEALKLLNFQIDYQNDNRHFKTVSMIYYKSLNEQKSKLDDENYFKEKISNNLFYGMEDEFAIYSYIIPKPGLGLRNYKLFTYPMRILYYSIGIYLMKVSEEFRKQFLNKRKDKALSYCGYGVDFENGKLNITKKNIYYINYYKDFTKNIKKELKSNKKNKIVIKLDIQNFFDEISIPTLLELLELFIKPSEKQQMGFDAHTREQIIFFFRFITNDGKGIPQSDNDIISSFIGNLYLLFGDLFIEQELSEYKDFCELYKIILYIDDIYISITYKTILTIIIREYVESICFRISYLLYYKLCLRLNLKTKTFFLDKEDQFEQLISSLKKVSSEHYEIDDIDDDCQDDYEEKINKIFNTLEQLKHIPMNPVTFDRGSHGEILKGVFDKAVLQMLEIDDNKKLHSENFC